MTGDRFNYYLKTIMNASLPDYSVISELLENDMQLSVEEVSELERLIGIYLSIHNKGTIRVVNNITGKEEIPPSTKEDDFGGTSIYEGEVFVYGLKWKVYRPANGFENSAVQKWYYNERVSSILDDILSSVVPGRIKNYFELPPWVLGTIYAPNSYYLPIADIINLAIARRLITGWEFLIESGIPRNYIETIRSKDLGNIS